MKKPILFLLFILTLFSLFCFSACAAGQAERPEQPEQAETQPDQANFRALFISDSQADPDTLDYSGFTALLKQAVALEDDIRFVLHGGDLINDGADRGEWEKFLAAIQPIKEIPFYPAWGNHDDGGFLADMFQLPQNGPEGMQGRFYSFSYENAHFIIMDSNNMGRHNEAYTQWLRQDIANTGKQWNILVMHHPLYLAMDNERDAMRAAAQREIWRGLLEETGIDLVLCGHQHMYMRSKQLLADAENADGIVYLMVGSGDKQHYTGMPAEYIQVLNDQVSSFVLLGFNEEYIEIMAYDAFGAVIDAFRITGQGVEEVEIAPPADPAAAEDTADAEGS